MKSQSIRIAMLASVLMCACDGELAVVGGAADANPTSDIVDATLIDATLDAPAEAALDALAEASIDAPLDVGPDGPRLCTSPADCTDMSGRGVCDVATGRCVQCVPSMDTCPVTEHCEPMTNSCQPGCRSDDGCAASAGGGDAGADGGAIAASRCNVATHACVQCVTDAHCPPGNVCTGNVCTPGCNAMRACPSGQTCCDSACVDPRANVAHCGACDARCAAENAVPACINGTCGIGSCMAPFGDCDMTSANGCEVNTRTSTDHCGACGAACPARANAAVTCADGACAFACNAGFADCNTSAADGCEADLRASTAHCGACGMACSAANATPACAAGRCAIGSCMSGFADCDGDASNGCEVDTRSSLTHCGACRNACPARASASSICTAGVCGIACDPGFSDCDGVATNGCEVDTRTSTTHCGACGRACSAAGGAPACVASVCAIAGCDPGRGDCDGMVSNGCEVDLRASLTHCGACGTVCPARANATATCAAGSCGFTCAAGFGDCDGMAANGCETDLRASTSHCGRCGGSCSLSNATPTCTAGLCAVESCTAAFGNCDGMAANGCETDVRTSVANCGRCGAACTFANAAGLCRDGACSMGSCNAGFSDCDFSSANGCETAGACVYTSCNAVPRAAPSGVYTLNAGGTPWRAYCEMSADGGGWTLVMKVPGRDGRFVYTSAIWTDPTTLNPTSLDLSSTPAKFVGFSALPFTQLRLGMVDGSPRYIVVSVSPTALPSIASVFAGASRATGAGRTAWRSLVASPSLQPFCNSEGFNLRVGSYQAVRLGILTNQENDCGSPDSRIGFGGEFNLCSVGGDVSCGNVASCTPDSGDRNTALFGYIFVR